MKRLALIVLAGLAFGATAAYATTNGNASTPHRPSHADRRPVRVARAFRTAPVPSATAGDESSSTSPQDDGGGSGDLAAPAGGGGDEQGDDGESEGDQQDGSSQPGDGSFIGDHAGGD